MFPQQAVMGTGVCGLLVALGAQALSVVVKFWQHLSQQLRLNLFLFLVVLVGC